MTQVVLLSGTTWPTPFNWNDADNSIEVIGAGGGAEAGNAGSGGTPGGDGGGGGEYRRVNNQTSSGDRDVQIGGGGAPGTG